MSIQNDWLNTEKTMQEEKYPLSFVEAMRSIGRIKSVIDLSEPYRCEDNPYVALVKDEDRVDYIVFYSEDCKNTTLQILENGFENKVLKRLLEGDHLYGHEESYKNYVLLLAYKELDDSKLTFRNHLFLNGNDTEESVWKMVMQDMFAWNLHEEADCVVMIKKFYETAMPPFEDFKNGLKAVVLDALANLSPNASSIDLRNGKLDFPMPITDKDYMEIYKELRDSFHTLQANGDDFLDVYENYKEENRAEYVDRTYKF